MHTAFGDLEYDMALIHARAEREYAQALVAFLSGKWSKERHAHVLRTGTDERRATPVLADTLRRFIVALRSKKRKAWAELFVSMFDDEYHAPLYKYFDKLHTLSPFREHNIIVVAYDPQLKNIIFGDRGAFRRMMLGVRCLHYDCAGQHGPATFFAIPKLGDSG